jgi:hypothetical protein
MLQKRIYISTIDWTNKPKSSKSSADQCLVKKGIFFDDSRRIYSSKVRIIFPAYPYATLNHVFYANNKELVNFVKAGAVAWVRFLFYNSISIYIMTEY